MKLGISNIAWPPSATEEVLPILRASGLHAIEVAPTTLVDWSNVDYLRLQKFRSLVENNGLSVSSLQSIFYRQPSLQLIQDGQSFDQMVSHLQIVGKIAKTLGAETLVFGSPHNRSKGSQNSDEAFQLASQRLRELGDVTAQFGITIAIEPVPSCYGADFLTSLDDVNNLVENCSHAFVRMHFDTACVSLGGDDVVLKASEYALRYHHFHIAERDLVDFANPALDHAAIGAELKKYQYDRYAVIEMRQTDQWKSSLIKAAQFASTCYN